MRVGTTPAAVKASAGAVEHLLLAPVEDLAGALAELHVRGLRVAGAEMDAPLTVREADLRGPLAIVVGSEGQGLGPAVRRRCGRSGGQTRRTGFSFQPLSSAVQEGVWVPSPRVQ